LPKDTHCPGLLGLYTGFFCLYALKLPLVAQTMGQKMII
jgi:hypothetical protein